MRTIVITGGAKGIGRCLVEYFASQGNAVYFIDMDADAVATVTEKLCAKQMNVYGFTGDIADEQVLQKFAARVIEETPQGIHCLINNACLMKGGILSGCSYDVSCMYSVSVLQLLICLASSSCIILPVLVPS